MDDCSIMQKPHLGKPCDHCGDGTFQLPLTGQEWHLTCDECKAIRFCYDPLPHQARFHKDPHRYKGFFGGYGSGKTTTACAETIDHILSTPRGTTLIGAATLPQLEQTAMKEFFEMFPEELIDYRSRQKNYIDIKNGHRVLFRPLDSEGKARSLNLTAAWIEEASEVNYEYFVQLTTRLRNKATKHHQLILSSNPDNNWIKTEILKKSDKIFNAEVPYTVNEPNKNISTHIAPTKLNTFLPPNFYADTSAGKPDWWVQRYLEGSFENREGLVYPNYADNIVEPFEIPKDWPKFMGADFGLVDPTTGIWVAINPEEGIAYAYDEHYENMQPISHHATKFKERLDKIPFGVLENIIGDAAGQKRGEKDMTSTFDTYAEHGIYFSPSTKKLEDTIMKKYGYLQNGKLKIFSNLKHTIDEFQKYKYPERSIDGSDNVNMEKPIDKHNHLMDALRYVVAELPDNPEQLINPGYSSQSHIQIKSTQQHLPDALKDDRPTRTVSDWVSFY